MKLYLVKSLSNLSEKHIILDRTKLLNIPQKHYKIINGNMYISLEIFESYFKFYFSIDKSESILTQD